MTRINVLGGTGYGGAAVVRETARRGHTVISFSRQAPEHPIDGVTYRLGSLLDTDVLDDAVRDAEVVFVAVSPRGDMAGRVEGLLDALVERAAASGVRVGVLGGASSLLMSPGGPRLFDAHPPAPEIRPEVLTGLALLETLQASPDELDWFYVSPPLDFGACVPKPVTGSYRLSDDVLLVDELGRSTISADDLAVAVLDEVEQPRHRRRRFHVAH
ncbi:MAG: NAD(P)H-binding protein [Actinomycetota bacterium]|nr:NAD(P)H-binding protein [Actinomycetota bacterium]